MPVNRSMIQRLLLALIAPAYLSCAQGVPVTGQAKPTSAADQSETDTSFQNNGVITVTYNDETNTDTTILYTDQTRTVLPGATLLGWSYSTDNGQNWTYGGKVGPPDGWAALWGDPAITNSSQNQNFVFISNLAVPASRMPSGGILCTAEIPGCMYTALGGACIVRSTDSGKTFQNYQCVSNNNDFYDGGSMMDTGDGRIFAAFDDVATGHIDVWMSPDENGAFSLLPNPFPGRNIQSHPRLRADHVSNTLYVAAQASDQIVYMNRYSDGWNNGNGVAASYPGVIDPNIYLSDRILRTGPQFSFDFGAASQNGNDEIRMLYTTNYQAQRLYVRGSFCAADLSACRDAPEWGTTPGNLNISGDQFNPAVRAFGGFIGLPPVWKAVYLSRENDLGGNTVSIEEGNLAVLPDGVRVLLPFDQITGLLVCSDERGYWGDYNDLQFIGFQENSTAAQFLSTYSDSTNGCIERHLFTSKEVHVSSTNVQ